MDYTAGFPGMTIIGLTDAAIQESRECAQAAVRNAGVPFPCKRLVVNLAPNSVRKEGLTYDLPIAVGVLEVLRQPLEDKVRSAGRRDR